jgi:hypothetical protein
MEILEDWSFHRQSSEMETRYLVIGVEPVAPLPLISGSITPAIPALRPAARATMGTFAQAVHMHAQSSAKARIDELRQVLISEGLPAMEAMLASGVGGTRVTVKNVGWLPLGETRTLPKDPLDQVASLEEGQISEIFYADNAHQLIQRLDTRVRFNESLLALRGTFDPSGFICLLAFGLASGLLWNRRLGAASVALAIGVGSVGFCMVQGPSPLTISVQNAPGGPFTPFVLSGHHSLFPGLCAGCALAGGFVASYGTARAPAWLIRLSKSLASVVTGLATGFTSLYLFFQLWPPVDVLDPWKFFQLMLVSNWPIVVPASCVGGAICAFWNSRPARDKLGLV